MKSLIVFALAASLALPACAPAEQGPAKSQKSQKRPPAAAKRPAADLRPQVAEQLKLLARFLYLYGKISAGFETAEEQARKGEMPESLAAKNKQNKASVVANIGGIKTGLEKLQDAFRANPQLQRQYLKLLAASDAAANAEQLAKADRFDEAGRALVGVAERLADLLAQM